MQVESRETMLPVAPPDRPIEVQFLPLEESATDARLDDITDPVGDYPHIDALTVTDVSIPEHAGPTSDNGITAQIENTGSGTVEFTPVVALLDGNTIVKVLGFTGPETATLAAGETYQFEQPVVLPLPGGFDDTVVYPVTPIFE